MIWLGIKMLIGEKGKYLSMIAGVLLASMIITQQSSIFTGLMSRTFGFLKDTQLPDLWVIDPKVQFLDDLKPLQSTQLLRVRGISGVDWAMPMYKGTLRARLPNGTFQSCIVVGLDDATLVGGPPIMIEGQLADLRRADSVIVDDVGAKGKLAGPPAITGGPKTPLKIGDTLELNDKRAVVVGFARVTRTFQSQPVIFTTYSRAMTFAPRERRLLSFVLVKAKQGEDLVALKDKIERQTGLKAYTNKEFSLLTFWYYMRATGIPINFGISIFLALIIGTAIVGQTFYSFTLGNLRYFGALKAMGASNRQLLAMVLVQASMVGAVGYGLGVGVASLFYFLSRKSELAFRMIWQIPALSGTAVVLVCLIAAVLSLRKVIKLEPAMVFRS